jgi:hypothetical protein
LCDFGDLLMMLQNFIVDKGVVVVVPQLRKNVIVVLEEFKVEVLP